MKSLGASEAVADGRKYHRKNQHEREDDEDDLQNPHSSLLLDIICFIL
jgi:hypothetical protein